MSESLQKIEETRVQRSPEFDETIDALEARALAELQPIECPLQHHFTPGLYVRTIFMPKGSLVTSKIHKTEHPFVVHSGSCSVLVEDEEENWRVEHIEAPYMGTTKPGTRRALLMHEDTVWSTFHPITEDEQGDVEKIEARIIEQRFLSDGQRAHDHYLRLLEASRQLAAEQEGEAR